MKLNKILNESQASALEDFKKIIKFSNDPTYDEKKNGWVFEGNISFVDNAANINNIPHPIAEVNGNVIMSTVAADFKSIKNYPRYIKGNAEFQMSTGLVNLTTDSRIIVDGDVKLLGLINLKNLSGFDLKCRNLNLTNLKSLETITSFPGYADEIRIQLSQCASLGDDLTKVSTEITNRVVIAISKKLTNIPPAKLMRSVLFDLSDSNSGYAPVSFDVKSMYDGELKNILLKYQGKGTAGMISLIRELVSTKHEFANLL
jgi:hypothetical protein